MNKVVNCGEHPVVLDREVRASAGVRVPRCDHTLPIQFLKGKCEGIKRGRMNILQLNNFP